MNPTKNNNLPEPEDIKRRMSRLGFEWNPHRRRFSMWGTMLEVTMGEAGVLSSHIESRIQVMIDHKIKKMIREKEFKL